MGIYVKVGYKSCEDLILYSQYMAPMEKFDVKVSSMALLNEVRTALHEKLNKLNKNNNKINWKNSLRNANETFIEFNKHIKTSNKNTTMILPDGFQGNDGVIITTANSKLLCYDYKFFLQCMIPIEKYDVSAESNEHIESSNQNTPTISSRVTQNKSTLSTTMNSILLCDDPKLNLQCMVLIEKFNISMELNKYVQSTAKNTTTISSQGVQNNDGILNTLVDSTLLRDNPKLNLQCMVLIEKFNISMKLNKYVQSSAKNTTTMSSQGAHGGILSTSVNSILLCDPKLNLQCMVLIEKFNINRELNKHVQSSDKNTNIRSKELQNDGILSTITGYTSLCHDPKLNLRCVILIKKFGIDGNISEVKSSNNFPSKINTSQEKNGNYDNNNSKTNWEDSLTCTYKSIESDCKLQGNVLSKCTNDESSLSNKVNIKTHINKSTSPIYLMKQMKENTEILNKINEKTSSNYILNKKVPIYKKQQTGNNKSKESVDDLYEFDEFDTDKMKIHRNAQHNFNNSRKSNRSMYILQNLDIKKTKLKVKNKNRRNIKCLRTHKYNETMQEIIQKIMKKVCIKNNSKNQDDKSMMIIDDKNIENILEHEIPIPDINSSFVENDDSTSDNSSEEFFSFNCNSHSTPSKINPTANGTMLSSEKYSPWRFSENVKRNPHFIIIKKTALPCLQQDMVLDYIQLKEIEKHFSKTQKKSENTKLVQKSILDFMNVSSYNVSNQENILHSNTCSNLFDYSDFSPSKIVSQNCSSNKAKRNILTPRQDNSKNVQVEAISTQNNPISNYKSIIGFDNNEIVLLKDSNISSKPRKCTSSDQNVFKRYTKEITQTEILPLKCQLTMNSKEVELFEDSVPCNSLKNMNKISAEDKTTKEVASIEMTVPRLEESCENQSIMLSKEGRLFEEPEQVISLNKPPKIYESKKRKRRLVPEILDEDESKPKKKNMMTKEEEAELEKWAAQFNDTCEEIEQYRLDIE